MLLIIIAVVLVAAVLGFWFFALDHRTPQQIMETEDGRDPLKRWARTAYSIVNGKFDPGATDDGSVNSAKQALARDWSIERTSEYEAKQTELMGSPSGNVAWDQIRRIVMARMAASAGLISQEASWEAIATSQQELQKNGDSWKSIVSNYRAGLDAWSQSDSERLAMFDLYVKDVSEPLQAIVPFK